MDRRSMAGMAIGTAAAATGAAAAGDRRRSGLACWALRRALLSPPSLALTIMTAPAPKTTAVTRFVPPMTLTAISWGVAGSTFADWREASVPDRKRPRFGGAF